MSNDVRFNPPAGVTSYPIVLLSGHSLCVHRTSPVDGKPGTPVPVRFRKEVLSQGCSPVGIDVDHEDEQGDTKSELIVKAIEAVIERNSEAEVESDGTPKLAAVKKQAGFNITKPEFEAGFESFKASLA